MCPLGWLLFSQLNFLSKNWQRNPDEYFLKSFISLTKKIYKGLTQWDFLPLGPTLIYTSENLTTLTNKTNRMNLGILTWSHSINWWRKLKSQNRHPHQNLPQKCRGRKYVYPVWIRPTYNFLAQPRTGFRINKYWSSKFNTLKSKINKISIEWINWRIF